MEGSDIEQALGMGPTHESQLAEFIEHLVYSIGLTMLWHCAGFGRSRVIWRLVYPIMQDHEDLRPRFPRQPERLQQRILPMQSSLVDVLVNVSNP